MAADLTFAIGDVHGCRNRLRRLLARCSQHAGGPPKRLVFVGDYIDRGPDSRGVIQDLLELQHDMPDRVVFLRGNHEMLLLDAIATGDVALWQFVNGGDATLASYRIDTPHALPPDHVGFFRSLLASFDDGLRFFVHAGVDPSRALNDQRDHDLAWMREPFLSTERDYGRLIVHGHTPQRNGKPDLRSWRLNIDTAAVYGGRLTAAVFNDAQRDPVAFLTDDGDAS